eukprot:7388533-Prymnesium_polylepis.1
MSTAFPLPRYAPQQAASRYSSACQRPRRLSAGGNVQSTRCGAVIVVIRALRVERFDLSRQGLTTEHDLQIGQIARAKAPARIVERGVIGRRGTADAGRYHCCWACTADTPSGRVNARVGGPLDRGLRPHDHILRTTRPAVVPRRIKDEVVLAGVIHPSPAIGPPVLRQHRLHVKSVYGQSDIARASDPEGAGLVVSLPVATQLPLVTMNVVDGELDGGDELGTMDWLRTAGGSTILTPVLRPPPSYPRADAS